MISTWVNSFSQSKADRKPEFDKYMSDSYRQAFHMAYRLTSNRAEAEDLVQEAYVRAFRFFHRYDDSLPFVSWLYRIMTNIHIDNVRKRSRLKTLSIDQANQESGREWDLPDERCSSDHLLMDKTLEEPFQLALRSMNPEFRMAVVLADLEGMSYEEIAEIMQTSVGTVRSRIHRGRGQIRTYLEKSYPEVVMGASQ
ncbi:sigma-70 family RNA polymerase sigma factor [Kamptonema cortianum]|nr:sigma-70 family RNA polymerase sigma factor [Kamptonema cortianum]